MRHRFSCIAWCIASCWFTVPYSAIFPSQCKAKLLQCPLAPSLEIHTGTSTTKHSKTMQSLSTALTCPNKFSSKQLEAFFNQLWQFQQFSSHTTGHHWTTPFHTSWASQCQCPLASVRAHHWHHRQSLQWFRQSASVSCCILGRIRPAMECHGGNSAGDWIRWINTSLVQLRCFTILIKRWSSRDQAVARNRWWMAWWKIWKLKCMFDIFWHILTLLYIVLWLNCSWSSALACEIPGCQVSFVCVWVRCEKRQRPRYLAQRQSAAIPIQLSQANKSLSREGYYKLTNTLQTPIPSLKNSWIAMDFNGFHMY